MAIGKNVVEVRKNFTENHAEVHGLQSPGRNAAETSYISQLIFLVSKLKSSKYDAMCESKDLKHSIT